MEKSLEERIKEGEKIRKEFESNKDYQDFIFLRGLIETEDLKIFSLLKINNNLKRIADSLDAIFLKM